MIRTFHPSDLTEITEIWLNANLEAHDFIPASYWENHLEQIKELLPAAELYLYEASPAAPLGFIGMTGDYIAGIFIKDIARSKGIGKQLLDHVKALRQGLTLHVYQKNERAVRFYQREGFCILSQTEDDHTGESEYLMTWRKTYD